MNERTTHPLAAADAVAQGQSARQDPHDPVSACPLAARHVVEACVVGEDDTPLAAVGVELRCDALGVLRSKTDRAGLVRFEGLADGAYRLALYELDRDAWQLLSREPLAGAARRADPAEPAWRPAPTPDAVPPRSVVVAQGDSIASLAQRYGAHPRTLWTAAENAALRATREHPNVLLPGDVVVVPAPRPAEVPAALDERHRVVRLGVPEVLKIRFLDSALAPRPELPYLFEVDDARAQVSGVRRGATDAQGVLREPVPLDATRARVTLLPGAAEERYEFALGHVDPLDTLSGVQARLNSLGFACGAADGQLTPATTDALREFQRRRGLPVTGEADASTRAALEAVYVP